MGHCKTCDQIRPIESFRRKGTTTKGNPSYGKCISCETNYDRIRRGETHTIKHNPYKIPTIHSYSLKGTLPNAVQRVSYIKKLMPKSIKECKECSKSFVKDGKRSVFCTTECCKKYLRRIRKSYERARLKSLKVDNVDPILVFDRCNWHCCSCGKSTPKHLRGKHTSNSPELDHIIPLSKGGSHSYSNTQLLCRLCNNKKSNLIVQVEGRNAIKIDILPYRAFDFFLSRRFCYKGGY